MLEYVLFIVGFVFLIKGAGFLVDGSSSIARRFGIPPIVIGLTLVAFGTSFPELAVNILSVSQSSDIPVGNVIGSNIANILLILGIAALVSPIVIPKNTVWKEIPFGLVAALVLAALANDRPTTIGSADGIILLVFFVVFLNYIFGLIKSRKSESKSKSTLGKQVKIKTYSQSASILMVLIGLVGLVIGGRWVVDGAVIIAQQIGISQALISLTIVSVGTSLPELATSIVAMRKKASEIAVGNIVGSSIFNIFFILGVSSIIKPLAFSTMLNIDILIVVASTLLLFGFMFVGRKHTLDKWQGLIFILLYAAYLVYIIQRG